MSNVSQGRSAAAGLWLLTTAVSPFLAPAARAVDVLPPVVVTAARIEQSQADALPHTTVLTAEDIRNAQATDLPALLQREAGIQIEQMGGPGQPLSMFMRGQSPSHALILVDGVPFGQQGFTGAPALQFLPLSQIEQVEVVRGNASAIYGSGAIGGVIQIFTKKPGAEPASSVTAEAGSFGTRSLSAAHSGSFDGLRYLISAGRATSDGISANNRRQYPNENPDRDAYGNNSASLSLAKEWDRGQELGVRASGNDAKYQFDGGGSGDPTDVAKGTNQQGNVALYSKNRFNEQWQSTLTLSHNELITQSQTNNAFAPYDIRDQTRATQLQWHNEIGLTANLSAVAGASAGRQLLYSKVDYGFGPSLVNYSRNVNNVYAGLNAKYGAHQWQANLRHDSVGGSGSDLTGYLGYGYQLNPQLKLIASASTAFNAPTLAQRFDAYSGNPGLKSEKATSYELGFQFAQGASLLRAVAFYTRTRNQFAPDPDPATCSFNHCATVNLLSSHNKGVELSATQKFGDTSLRASLTVQDPVDDSTGETLFRRSHYFGSLAASRAVGSWLVGGDVTFAGGHDDKVYFNTFPYAADAAVGAYGKASLFARNQVSKNLAVFARVDNLLNRHYQTVYGYNQLPRGVYAGLDWRH